MSPASRGGGGAVGAAGGDGQALAVARAVGDLFVADLDRAGIARPMVLRSPLALTRYNGWPAPGLLSVMSSSLQIDGGKHQHDPGVHTVVGLVAGHISVIDNEMIGGDAPIRIITVADHLPRAGRGMGSGPGRALAAVALDAVGAAPGKRAREDRRAEWVVPANRIVGHVQRAENAPRWRLVWWVRPGGCTGEKRGFILANDQGVAGAGAPAVDARYVDAVSGAVDDPERGKGAAADGPFHPARFPPAGPSVQAGAAEIDFGVVVIAVVAGHGRGIVWRADETFGDPECGGVVVMALAPDRSARLLVYSPACALRQSASSVSVLASPNRAMLPCADFDARRPVVAE